MQINNFVLTTERGAFLMGRKSKHNKGTKLKAVKQYIEGVKSSTQLAKELNISNKTILKWTRQFQTYGELAFDDKPRNKSYSKELKLAAISDYLNGLGSLPDISLKYGITSSSILYNWKYNSHKEIKDYDPKGDVYMTKSRKTNMMKN